MLPVDLLLMNLPSLKPSNRERLAAAGLDVTEIEPLPQDKPFVGYGERDSHATCGWGDHSTVHGVLSNFSAIISGGIKRGEPLQNVVRKTLGF